MAIMNFLFSRKSLSAIFFLLFLASCSTLRTREEVQHGTTSRPTTTTPSTNYPTTNQTPTEIEQQPPVEQAPPPAPVIPTMPKIGIILGAGGAKTYAHIGFLQEMSKLKIPAVAIGGVEFASPMAALYAKKELANEVEWQMFKLKDEEVIQKSLLGSVHKNNEVTVLKDFFNVAFPRMKAEDFRVPFTCPAYNFKKNQLYLMNKGSMDQVLYMCMAYPPFFKPYGGTVSAVRELTAVANYLRSKGANYIVLINVLQAPGGKAYTLDANATDNVLWSEIAGLYNKPLPGIDNVISLDTSDYGIMDFNKRRDIMLKGADSAARQLKVLARKWGY
jgi:NTE family protein